MVKYRAVAVAVAVAVSGGGAVAVAVVGLTKSFFHHIQKVAREANVADTGSRIVEQKIFLTFFSFWLL